MTHVIYADKGAIIVEGATVYPMDGDITLGEHVMFEIPAQLNQVTIVPLYDNAAFKYFDDAYSFGKINDDTIGIFTLASSGEGSLAGLTITQRSAAKKIFSTKYDATFLNWILFFVCFGWIWMWF